MDFEKIKVVMSNDDAHTLAENVLHSYLEKQVKDGNTDTVGNMLSCLKEYVLDIYEPFKYDKWNSCDASDIPDNVNNAHLIFRQKCMDHDKWRDQYSYANTSYGVNCSYYIGFWLSCDGQFRLSPVVEFWESIQDNINRYPQNWEFYVIPR